jgi:hypothetical protein
MRKWFLMVLAGLAIMLAVPEFAAATPMSAGNGLANAAEQVGNVEQAWYYRRYRFRRHYVHRYHYRHYYRRHYYRRYW